MTVRHTPDGPKRLDHVLARTLAAIAWKAIAYQRRLGTTARTNLERLLAQRAAVDILGTALRHGLPMMSGDCR